LAPNDLTPCRMAFYFVNPVFYLGDLTDHQECYYQIRSHPLKILET
jgi:hypothetical protein